MKRTFSRSQIICHWLVFLAIVMAYAAMELKGFAPKGSAARTTMAAVHYTAGLTVLGLMVGRVFLKITHRDPDILPPPPRWQRMASKITHGLLYLMFLALPSLGLASLYYGQVTWSYFGITLPVAAVANKNIQHSLKEWHELIANAGYFLIGLHALAALFHHYVARDNTLVRMLPALGRKNNR
ncbi:cytochrome b561 [Klebsiella sp. JB_Kp018]|uniref:cytochrome b561 n=1 Tax=Klebsiella TaxID=570 RepID=UPI0032B4105C|nr:cytochrome b561 [Klebsiella variicola]